MDIAVTVNFWFLISMCLIFALIGVIIGARAAGGHRPRY
jgi:hypothetical protein